MVVPKFNDGGIVVGVPNKFVVCFAVLASPAPLPKVTPDEAFAEKYLLNLSKNHERLYLLVDGFELKFKLLVVFGVPKLKDMFK